jgi:hypothetical protein
VDGLEVKREGNAIKVDGVSDYLAKLKKTRPHWFQDYKAPVFNDPKGGKPGEGKDYTPEELMALRKKNPVEYQRVRRELAAKRK